ncbi:MAG: hypothetical protein H6Q70_2092 [Firmicutes bacterium]|nr:hypothetical protein [Bacillota bacterium]
MKIKIKIKIRYAGVLITAIKTLSELIQSVMLKFITVSIPLPTIRIILFYEENQICKCIFNCDRCYLRVYLLFLELNIILNKGELKNEYNGSNNNV